MSPLQIVSLVLWLVTAGIVGYDLWEQRAWNQGIRLTRRTFRPALTRQTHETVLRYRVQVLILSLVVVDMALVYQNWLVAGMWLLLAAGYLFRLWLHLVNDSS